MNTTIKAGNTNIQVLETDTYTHPEIDATLVYDNNYGDIASYPIDVIMSVSVDDTTYNITFQDADIFQMPHLAGFVSFAGEVNDDSASFLEILDDIDDVDAVKALEDIAQKLYGEAVEIFNDIKSSL